MKKYLGYIFDLYLFLILLFVGLFYLNNMEGKSNINFYRKISNQETRNKNDNFVEEKNLENNYTERWFSPIDRTLRRELKSKFSLGEFWFDTTSYKELIDLRIRYEDGYFKFLVPRDRVTSSSARIFALWITVPAFIMVFISSNIF